MADTPLVRGVFWEGWVAERDMVDGGQVEEETGW